VTKQVRDALIICTRNRSEDMARCLASLMTQKRLPTTVLVVDSSDDTRTQEAVEDLQRQPELSTTISYLRAERGLTKQRNAGLAHIGQDFDVVHFIDDDVEMERLYIDELDRAFEADDQLVGAGGMVLGGNRRRPRLTAVLGGRDSHKPGSVIRTGFNIGAHETPSLLAVEWLPGCSMSFRVARIGQHRFDEQRTGYAIGEDVDFGMKMASEGMLLHVPSARLVHHQSPVNRMLRSEITRMAVHHRWQLAEDRLGRVSKLFVVLGTLSECFSYAGKALVHRDRALAQCSTASIRGLVDVVRSNR
jgi:GT2 family glycosyltransferase